MIRPIQLLVALLALSPVVSLGPALSAQPEHHHENKTDLRVVVEDNPENRVMTVLLGPVDLSVGTGHVRIDRSDTTFTIPFDGWVIAYSPDMVDKDGNTLPSEMLHHADFFNIGRLDFVCPPFPEYIFAVGREISAWPSLPEAGYPVAKGNKIRIRVMFHNDTGVSFPEIYLRVKIEYRFAADHPRIRSLYPVWFSVNGCGHTAYDLIPGESETSSEFTVRYPGKILAIGGHMHDYGRKLRLENLNRKSDIGMLHSNLSPEGRFLSMPVVVFPSPGITVERGDVLKVSALYDSPMPKTLAKGAMGIVFGYFQPENDEAFRALKPDMKEIFKRFNRRSNNN